MTTPKTLKYIDLDSINLCDLMNFIYNSYSNNIRNDTKVNFIGQASFNVTIYDRWIFVGVETKNEKLIEIIKRFKHSMVCCGKHFSVYAFFQFHRPLQQVDLEVVTALTSHLQNMNLIEVESEHVVFKRFVPQSLLYWSQRALRATEWKQMLPPHVTERLVSKDPIETN